MGRWGALFEVQRYYPEAGWIAPFRTAAKPIWFRSLERASVELHAEMLRCRGQRNGDRVALSSCEFDPSAYRITDGITIWTPAWNADRTGLAIRIDVSRAPADFPEFPGRVPQPNRTTGSHTFKMAWRAVRRRASPPVPWCQR
jgi:hypothetical protein